MDETIENTQASVSKVEDEIYRKFCKRLGYTNIREYEAQQGSLQEEASQKKLEFTTQKSRIENQLSFEKQRIQATEDRINGLQAQYERDMSLIEGLKSEQEEIRNSLDESNAELELLRENLEKQKEIYAESAENLAEQRRELQKRSKHVESALKNINALEAEIQRNSSSRYALLRRCKLEDIDIPLTDSSKSLDKLPIDDLVQAADPDAMDVDEADEMDETPVVQDYGIEVDFDSLGESLKEVRCCSGNPTDLWDTNRLSFRVPTKSLRRSCLRKSELSTANWTRWPLTHEPWNAWKVSRTNFAVLRRTLRMHASMLAKPRMISRRL